MSYRVVEAPGPGGEPWTWAEASSPELAERALAAVLERHPELADRLSVVAPPEPQPLPISPAAPEAEAPLYFFETDGVGGVRRTDLRRGTRPGGWVV